MYLRGFRYALGLTGILLVLLFAQAAAGVELPETRNTFSDLDSLHNGTAHDYTTLDIGDEYIFEDVVLDSILADQETVVYFLSTGQSAYSPTLIYPGDHTSLFIKGAQVRIRVEIIGDPANATWEAAEADILGVQVIKEAVEHRIDKEKISIFRFDIDREWIPDDLETPWGEFAIMLVLWSITTVILWLIFHRVVLVIAKKTKTNLDLKIFNIIRVPFFTVLLLYGLLVSLARVVNDDLTDVMYGVYISGLIIMVTYSLARVFKLIVSDYLVELAKKTETKADDALLPLISKTGTGLIWVVGVIMFLDTLGLDITVFVMGMGVMGLVVAFAAQDTMSNLFSGIMILIDRPFSEGDWIQLDDNVYQVVDIGLRSTRMFNSIKNQMVTIPNSRISDHMFSNLNLPDTKGRITVKVGVGYGSDPKKVGRILLDLARDHPDTFQDEKHEPFYRFSSFGDSSLDFSLTLWVKNFNDQWRVSSEVKEMIFYRFAREGIEIPFPQRVVHHVNEDPAADVKKDTRAPSPDMKNLAP